METEHDGIRAIARRAAGRVRAAGGSPLAPTPGVHVQVRSVTGPGGGDQANATRALVEADCLSRLADGEVLGFLADLGFPSRDMGTGSDAPCDYPDFAAAVAREVSEGRAQFGIVIDGAGIGSAMAAGKISGVLAANCWSQASAFNARTHNHANLLTLGAGHLDSALAREIVETFLKTPTGPGRHANRVKKIQALDLPRPSIGHLSR